jgi:hypothetical protein
MSVGEILLAGDYTEQKNRYTYDVEENISFVYKYKLTRGEIL